MQAEIASAVVPPGANGACADGQLVVTWARHWRHLSMRASLTCLGQPGCSKGLTESGDNALPVPADTVWYSNVAQPDGGACTPDLTVPKYVSAGGDVVMARLPNGEVAQLGLGFRRRNAQWPNCDSPPKDVDALILRVSPDCGATWPVDRVRTIDADDVTFVLPNAQTHPGNQLDRPEIHYDPWTEALHVSVKARYDDPTTPGVEAYGGVLFESANMGASWQQVRLGDEWTPYVMTSTPAGRLYLFHCIGSEPRISWVDPGGTYSERTLAPALPREHTCGILHSWFGPNPVPGDVRNLIGQVGISLAESRPPRGVQPSLDVLRVVYPHLGFDPESNRGRQEARVATFSIADDRDPTVLEIKRIVATSPQDSVLHMTFVQPERAGRNPLDPLDGAAVLTWLETESTGGLVQIHQKALVVAGTSWSPIHELTVENGQPSPWAPCLECGLTPTGTKDCWLGDYHYSAFVDKQDLPGVLRLLVVWPESDPTLPDAGTPSLLVHSNMFRITWGGPW
jgi:hypothetical protein